LGLLPKRRTWLGCGDCGCPAFAGQNLRKPTLVKSSTDEMFREAAVAEIAVQAILFGAAKLLGRQFRYSC